MNYTVNLERSGDFIGYFSETFPPATLSSPVLKVAAWETDDGAYLSAPRRKEAIGGGLREIDQNIRLQFRVEFAGDGSRRMLVPTRYESFVRNHPNFRPGPRA